MQEILNLFARLALTLVCALVLMLTTVPAAWSQTPTQEQLDIFRSLPPDQQQQILDQIAGSRGAQQGAPAAPAPVPATPTTAPKTDDVTAKLVESLQKEPRLRAGDSLLLTVEIRSVDDLTGNEAQSAKSQLAQAQKAERSPEAERAMNEFQRQLLDENPYQLDRLGRLSLRGMEPIVLAGLTEAEASLRLNADPALQDFKLAVKLLPVEPELKPFGYDLFTNVPTTFAPATDIPVPSEYVLGPGDTLQVQLIGQRGGSYTLTVGRDGTIDFPQLGPIAVAGMRFAAAKSMLEQKVADEMIGMRASISMGPLRSIQVFVLGEAVQPGSYTVSGLATISNALFASGGVKTTGSLRNIQLKRAGKLVRQLDLYDLLLNGDTSNDSRLMSGDVIFIPPVGATVAVSGEVQRPAIYEVREGAVASELLYLSGGLTPEADPRAARLERIDGRRDRTVVDLDLTAAQGRSTRLQAGDSLLVRAIRDSFEGSVRLEGQVYHPGGVQYRPGMRLTDAIGSLDELKPLADVHYVLLRRETGPTRKVSVLSADAAAAFANPASAANVPLQARDRIYVFDLATSRDRIIAPITEELSRQSAHSEPLQTVGVGGHVKVPGQYPLEPGMKLSDLLRAGGGLDQSAFGGSAEIARYTVVDGERRQTDIIEVNLARVLDGDAAADIVLRPFDFLLVKEVPQWRDREYVEILGEVRFPGKYPIKRGETLKSLLRRVGGLTDLAYPAGTVFTRRELKEREQRQIDLLVEKMQGDLATLSLQQSQSTEGSKTSAQDALAAGQGLLADLKSSKAVGRLVVDLDDVIKSPEGSPRDVILRDDDRILIPPRPQEVTVMGEVQNASSFFYDPAAGRDSYVAMSGGTTRRADTDRIYVVRANGAVAVKSGSRWFGQESSEMLPGDTIVVPLDVEKMRPLPLWTAVTTIIYNTAIAVAALHSL